MSSRHLFIIGAIVMGLAVALGAFGAHGLQKVTDAKGLANWETGVRYQAIHGLALLILSLAYQRFSLRAVNAAALCFVAGMVVFCGTLYTIVLTGNSWYGRITPIGGLLLLIGWGIMAVAHKRRELPSEAAE